MYAYCNDLPGVSEDIAASVEAQIGDATVPGLVAHVSGPTKAGWRIIDVWESEDDYHRFQVERLNPALEIATRGHTPPSRPFEFRAVTSLESLARRG